MWSSRKTRTPFSSSASMQACGSVSSDSSSSGSTPSTSAPTVAPSFLVVSVPMVLLLSDVPATVHVDLLSGDVAGLLGTEEDTGGRDVLGRPEPAEWGPGDHRVHVHGARIDRPPHHRGVDAAGRDGVPR